MHGSVGTGKTMLLDLAHAHARKAGLRVTRVHFYEFILDLHQQIHMIQEERPVEVAANTLADRTDVFCFDEFQIVDVQDAAILPRLFEVLFLRGVAVLMTSNTPPRLLYSGGLNRHVHLPAFVALLADHCDVYALGGKGGVTDYRRRAEAAEKLAGNQDWDSGDDVAYMSGADAEDLLAARWSRCTSHLRESAGLAEAEPRDLPLPMGRVLRVSHALGRSRAEAACFVNFAELCVHGDRGEADFIALAEHFGTVFLGGLPRFASIEDFDAVKRFVKLLDVLYDRRVRLVVAAAAPIDGLFDGLRAEFCQGGDLAWRMAMYSADGKVGMAPSAVGTLWEAVRATERAESRLREMGTRRYWAACG